MVPWYAVRVRISHPNDYACYCYWYRYRCCTDTASILVLVHGRPWWAPGTQCIDTRLLQNAKYNSGHLIMIMLLRNDWCTNHQGTYLMSKTTNTHFCMAGNTCKCIRSTWCSVAMPLEELACSVAVLWETFWGGMSNWVLRYQKSNLAQQLAVTRHSEATKAHMAMKYNKQIWSNPG